MFANRDVQQQCEAFRNVLVETPCLFSPSLSELTGARVFLKLENMQKTGSFKERGALTFLLHRGGGSQHHVVAASAGNHAQAVALHAERLGIKATIFMPRGTPNTKVRATERYRGHVKLVGDNYDEAYLSARTFSDENNALYLPAYNDPHVILGQATIAHEIFSEVDPDAIFVPVGGGGLIAGITQYVANLPSAKTQVIGIEAQNYQSMAHALNKGHSMVSSSMKTIAEGIAVKGVGDLALDICRRHMPKLVSVNDRDIQACIMLLLERQKIIAEGAGAAAVAGLLLPQFRHSLVNKTVILIITGGNIDISLLGRLSAQELVFTSRLCRMSLTIKDTPGSLSSLLQTITKAMGNIVDIRHERIFADVRWNEVAVDVTVETKDNDHEQLMLQALRMEGYVITTHSRETHCGT